MKLFEKLLKSIADLNGEPNIIPPDNSNDEADNYFLINIFNNLIRRFCDNLECVGVEVSEGEVSAFITDGDDTTVLTFFDDEGSATLAVSDFDSEDDESETYDITDLNIYDGASFDFSKLDSRILDYFTDLSEAFLTVIRGGKKVKKKLKRIKRKKILSGARKRGIRHAVLKRKRNMAKTIRKRLKSLIIRRRSKLKHKPKKFKV